MKLRYLFSILIAACLWMTPPAQGWSFGFSTPYITGDYYDYGYGYDSYDYGYVNPPIVVNPPLPLYRNYYNYYGYGYPRYMVGSRPYYNYYYSNPHRYYGQRYYTPGYRDGSNRSFHYGHYGRSGRSHSFRGRR